MNFGILGHRESGEIPMAIIVYKNNIGILELSHMSDTHFDVAKWGGGLEMAFLSGYFQVAEPTQGYIERLERIVDGLRGHGDIDWSGCK